VVADSEPDVQLAPHADMPVKSLRHIVWTPALGLAVLIVAACALGQTPPGGRVCTLIACGPSLEIALVGDYVPTRFELNLTSSEGDTVHVLCTDGNAAFDPPDAARWSPTCPAGGVTLQDFTPQQVSVTARWSGGEVTQDFQPTYVESQPNGPACEPTCQTARVELRIPFIPAYGDTSTWETYTDVAHGFSFRYPAALTLEFSPLVDGYNTVFVGDKIQIQTSSTDPLVCQGDCPMMGSNEPVTIAGREARLVRGYIGSVGGNIPQRFMLYLIHSGSTYISLTLFAAGRQDQSVDDPSVIVPLQQADIELFNRLVQTVQMTP